LTARLSATKRLQSKKENESVKKTFSDRFGSSSKSRDKKRDCLYCQIAISYESSHENMEYSHKDNCIDYYSAKLKNVFQHQLYRENILYKETTGKREREI